MRRSACMQERVPLLLAVILPLTGCFPTDYGVNDLDPTPTCSKKDCGFDGAFIGGNVDIPNESPIGIQVETCRDGGCSAPAEFRLGARRYLTRNGIVVSGSGLCPEAPFACADLKKWWVGWRAPIEGADGGIVSSLRVIVRTLDGDDTLEDHEFDATYEPVAPRACEPRSAPDGGVERIRCQQFVASWD